MKQNDSSFSFDMNDIFVLGMIREIAVNAVCNTVYNTL